MWMARVVGEGDELVELVDMGDMIQVNVLYWLMRVLEWANLGVTELG